MRCSRDRSRRLSRCARLSILAATILLTGCHSFTLIGAVNLGGSDAAQADGNIPEAPVKPEGDAACWPPSKAFVAEIRSHGYTFKTWPETAKYLAALEPVSRLHPVCK